MVSFWPWKADDTSPASFEKTLSTLSAKISNANQRLDSLRQQSRRYSVLWTLYAGFAYLLCAIILVLVVGWQKWGIMEYAGITVGPAVIYVVRLGLTTLFEYRTSRVQAQLDELQKQRDSTIERLKIATKYNSTAEMLKKYSGTPTPKVKPGGGSDRKVTPKGDVNVPRGGKTAYAPPPTANIPGRIEQPPPQGTPHQGRPYESSSPTGHSTSPWQSPVSPQDASADFAPNAFPAAPQYAQMNEGSSWYNRIMDVLLGEDETLPGKRLALICANCRLVNGQAPPGVKRLEDVGKWRCGGCGSMNGEENDVKKIVATIKQQTTSEPEGIAQKAMAAAPNATLDEAEIAPGDHESDITQYSSEEWEEGGEEGEQEEKDTKETAKKSTKPVAEPQAPRRRSNRPKADQKSKG